MAARSIGALPETWPQRRTFVLRRLLSLADIGAITLALALSTVLAGPGSDTSIQTFSGLLTLPVWVLLFKLYGLYDRDDKRVSHSTVDDVPWVFHAVAFGSLGMWFFYRLTSEKLVLAQGLAFVLLAFFGVLACRGAVRAIARHSTRPERLLLVGGGAMRRVLERKIRSHPEYRLLPIGYLSNEPEPEPESTNGDLPCLGTVADLEEVCTSQEVERVVLLARQLDEDSHTELVRRASQLDVRLSLVPELVDVLGPSVEIDDIEGITVLGLNPPVLSRSSRTLKRAMDLSVALTALLVTLPMVVIAAVAVKLTSAGPIVYSQERVGLRGRRFRVYKLRTMAQDADERIRELQASSLHPAWLLLDDDPRITPVGRLLRLTSIDELPQLWNVIRGDMSLVGPRPMTPAVHEHVPSWGHRRLDLTPGITGLWQVLGRTTIPFEEMIKLDYLYVTNWSLWQDVRLLIRTLPVVLRRHGAN